MTEENTPTNTTDQPQSLASAPCSALGDGRQYIEVGAAYRIPWKEGYRVWKCVGHFLGGLGHEDLIGLMALDRKCGAAHGKNADVMLMPLVLFIASNAEKC